MIDPQQIWVIGLSHKTTPLEWRERLYLDEPARNEVLGKFVKRPIVLEAAVLQTCNRLELYVVLAPDTSAPEAWQAWLQDSGQEELSGPLQSCYYWHQDRSAILHVFAVAASLDSLIVGETQITGQFKDAMAAAQQINPHYRVLGRLTSKALQVSKEVRRRTSIGERTVSLSHAAIDLVTRFFAELSTCRILVIGVGEMGQLAARYACRYQPKRLVIANRTVARAHALVEEIEYGEGMGIDDLPTLLRDIDVVISATASGRPLITQKMIEQVQQSREFDTLYMVDIGVPRDIDPACGTVDGVYLYEVDDLERVVESNKQEREREARQAQQYLEDAVDPFMRWLASMDLGASLERYRGFTEQVLACELKRSRSVAQHLSGEVLDALAKVLSKKLTAPVAQALREAGVEQQRDTWLEFIETITQPDRESSAGEKPS